MWKTGSVPISTRLPGPELMAVPMTTGAQVDSFEVNEGATDEQVGSPAMRSWYWANCAWVMASQVAPVTTETLNPSAVANRASSLEVPLLTVSPVTIAIDVAAWAGAVTAACPSTPSTVVSIMRARAVATTRAIPGRPTKSADNPASREGPSSVWCRSARRWNRRSVFTVVLNSCSGTWADSRETALAWSGLPQVWSRFRLIGGGFRSRFVVLT